MPSKPNRQPRKKFRLHQYHGILRHEMFAQKSMENKLLRLKLDMVYRGLGREEAEARFQALRPGEPEDVSTQVSSAPPPEPKTIVKGRKVVRNIKRG